MSSITFKIKDNTDEVIRAINSQVNLALDAMGEVVEGYAKEDTPVDTGLLRNSLTHARGGEKPGISSYHADNPKEGRPSSGSYPGAIAGDPICEYIGSNVEYAPYVEFKSMSHLVGKAHFLRDAGENHIDELRDKCVTVLKAISD